MEVAFGSTARLACAFDEMWNAANHLHRDQPGMHLEMMIQTEQCAISDTGLATLEPWFDVVGFTGRGRSVAAGNRAAAVAQRKGAALGLVESTRLPSKVE